MAAQPFWIILRSADGDFATYQALNGSVMVGAHDGADVSVAMSQEGHMFRLVSADAGPQVHDLTAEHGVSINGQLVQKPMQLADGAKLLLPGFTALYVFTNQQSYERFLRMWRPQDFSENKPPRERPSQQDQDGFRETEQIYQPPTLDDPPEGA